MASAPLQRLRHQDRPPPRHDPLRYLLRNGAFARTNALFEELPLHWVAREREGSLEMVVRDRMPPAAKLKLTECRVVERVGGETIRIRDRTNLFQSALRTLVLRDGDSAVQRNN